MKEFLFAVSNLGGAGLSNGERRKQLRVIRTGILSGLLYTVGIAFFVWFVASYVNAMSGDAAGWNLFVKIVEISHAING